MHHQVKAILGPTNTGKTHIALERILAHASGIIGFPLRLLAKENYDRMVAVKGEKYVGLITGEEKIIPPQAKWFSCTVEAMPIHIPVECIAIDEIQLCADPDRGHIFTERLLHCRGKNETLFLGSDTIQPILKKLVPDIMIETRPRLSALTHDGFTKLTKLPPRCAIVTFSAHEVYATAEIIKRQKGGCAIIMGRLSPRTRNAQMELYQNKEVDYLIATDAIGMGLNMNVNHIAFVSLSKYDGHQFRNLYPTEIAQIAGRAGRGMQDGTFGTTGNCSTMQDRIINAVENHVFDPLKQIYWRNSNLDFTNPAKLFTSLTQPSRSPQLISAQYASDLQTLSHCIQDQDILSICTNRQNTSLLWEACQIPDFRKLGNEYHARTCKQIFTFLIKNGRVPEPWIHHQIKQLNHLHGDIDTLMQRLASIRIYSYITAKNDWVESSAYWQAQTKEVEEQLSDALHDALMAKFINQRASILIRNLAHQGKSDLYTSFSSTGGILIEGEEIGQIQGFSFQLNDNIPIDERKLLFKTIQKQFHSIIPQQVQKLVQAENEAFHLDLETKQLLWDNNPVAYLKKGKALLYPDLVLIQNDFINQLQRELILKRLHLYMKAMLIKFLPFLSFMEEPTEASPAMTATLRGIFHQLQEYGGIIGLDKPVALSRKEKTVLRKYHIHYGHHALYYKNIFKDKTYRFRDFLLSLYTSQENTVFLSSACISHSVPSSAINPAYLKQMGWINAGKQLIRLDIAEKLTEQLYKKTSHFPKAFQKKDLLPLKFTKENIIALLHALKLFTMKPQQISKQCMGPPAPLLFSSIPFQKKRNRKLHQKKQEAEINHSFAILKTLYSNRPD